MCSSFWIKQAFCCILVCIGGTRSEQGRAPKTIKICKHLVGYHKKGYPNQSYKKRKGQKQINHDHRGTSSAHLTPSPQVQPTTRPTPRGLGRKFRLVRPLKASDASSNSSDPSGPRTQVPSRPTPQGFGLRHRLARSPRPRA